MINVGMASTSIGRKEVGFIYVDHTINSARGQEQRGCKLKVGGRVLNLWCDPTFISFFRNVFSLVHVPFFLLI